MNVLEIEFFDEMLELVVVFEVVVGGYCGWFV